MPTLSGKSGLATVAAVMCLGWSAAHAQSEPVRYGWIPFGFGGGATEATSPETYGGIANSDFGSAGSSGFSFRNEVIPVSALMSGLRWNDLHGATAFSSLDSLSYERSQFGYSFKGAGGLPMTVFGGIDALKYNPDVFSAMTAFSPSAGTAAAYSVHAGVEVRPTSNISLSLSAGFTQQQTGLAADSISSSLLPRELGGLR